MKPIPLKPHEIRRLQSVGEVLVVRVVKPQFPVSTFGVAVEQTDDFSAETDVWRPCELRGGNSWDLGMPTRCPLGKPGDRSWVRETWNVTSLAHLAPGEKIGKTPEQCVADNGGFAVCCFDGGVVYGASGVVEHPEFGKVRWRSSTTMPRWASRFTVGNVAVECKRVREVDNCECRDAGFLGGPNSIPGYGFSATPKEHMRHHFSQVVWDANPWCWFVRVKLVKP